MKQWPIQVDHHFRIHAVGYEHYTHWPASYPRRPFWRLYWNRQDGGRWLWRGTSYPLDGRHLLLIPPNVPVQRELTRPVDHAFVHFAMGMPWDLYRGAVVRVPAPQMMRTLVNCLIGDPASPQWAHTVSLLIHHATLVLPLGEMAHVQADPRVTAMLRLMQNNTSRLMTNAELARHCHLSEPAMIRLFRQVLGRSPQAFFLDMRLDEAAMLLRRESNLSIEQIAERTGFFDRSHFCKRFVTRYGLSPVAYRKTP